MAKGYIWLHLLVFNGILLSAIIGASTKESSDEEVTFTLMDPCTPLMEAAASSRKDLQEISDLFKGQNKSYYELAMLCLSWLKTAPLIAQSSMKSETVNGKGIQRRIRQTGPIYPGTKWCGPGDLATNYRDLGQLSNEDRCCRLHDMCPEQIIRGQCTNGLCNSSPFTRSHCECDESFRLCLQSLKTPAADTIGALYFNIGSNLCFAEARDTTTSSTGKSSEAESERKDVEVWRKRRGAPSLKTRRKASECTRKSTCTYKYYSQLLYVEATESIESASRRRTQQNRRSSRQSKYIDDEISNVKTVEQTVNQPAETISNFLYHLLRTTGVLLSKDI